jgi:hypothetical protein
VFCDFNVHTGLGVCTGPRFHPQHHNKIKYSKGNLRPQSEQENSGVLGVFNLMAGKSFHGGINSKKQQTTENKAAFDPIPCWSSQ